VRRVALAAGCALLAACATPPADLAPGSQPALEVDEAGFWMRMERVEHALAGSGHLVRDPVVTDYLTELACRLAPDYCGAIRIYVVYAPEFNAFMGPNGAMQVWTGLLLRAQNEAQLAYVLAHEIAHYQRRHTLQRWREVRAKTDLLMAVQLLSAAVGQGYVGSVAALVGRLGLLGFSRDQEREADALGFQMMVRAGYDPFEAPRIWQAVAEEQEATDEGQRHWLLSTHPGLAERIATLSRLAQQASEQRPGACGAGGASGETQYLEVQQRIRAQALRDELRMHRLPRSELLLERLAQAGVARGEVEYYRGELYRLRRGPGDLERARAHYQRALGEPGSPPQAHRELGLVHLARAEKSQAAEQLQRYLAAVPEAEDRAMIEHQLEELR
jgi:predicted Zn-dependent protease